MPLSPLSLCTALLALRTAVLIPCPLATGHATPARALLYLLALLARFTCFICFTYCFYLPRLVVSRIIDLLHSAVTSVAQNRSTLHAQNRHTRVAGRLVVQTLETLLRLQTGGNYLNLCLYAD